MPLPYEQTVLKSYRKEALEISSKPSGHEHHWDFWKKKKLSYPKRKLPHSTLQHGGRSVMIWDYFVSDGTGISKRLTA